MAACNDATHSHKWTGCTLGTAVMAALVLGLPLADAVIQAKVYVRQALLQAVACGQGLGCVGCRSELVSK
ncbi:bifunctional hydroxymethylpyrimidine kinase/phosphomethylpyrimidine kinase [Synechococcus sp. UW69]|uniref:bifunctional hydroxymethylpyrimidine kinase/phosphomethylpyrimidine kinase n=1 Tax=Synechococcus sp. UW69 TaxID=368493 RepID=UPI00352A108F